MWCWRKRQSCNIRQSPCRLLCYSTFVSAFCCSAFSLGFFPAYFIGCLADHVGMQVTSSEEVSQRGCHTRNKDSFLFSICSLRSWHCSSPVNLRSLQPDPTGSGRLHVARWVCGSKIQDPGPTPHICPCPQFPLPWASSAPECNVHIWRRGERNSHLISVQIVFYYRQEEDRMEKL